LRAGLGPLPVRAPNARAVTEFLGISPQRHAFANVAADGTCVSVNAHDDKINFPQLQQLKQQHPKLQTLVSIGGASHSANFSKVSQNTAKRLHLAQSSAQFMKNNGFDGIDIDWEYPAPADTLTFTALLRDLRQELDALGAVDKRSYLLTIAAPAPLDGRLC
jgi:chitinase